LQFAVEHALPAETRQDLEKDSHEGFKIVGVVWETETPEMRRALAPNERRVEDWYVTSGDAIYEIKQRITTDPSDSGRNYRLDATGNESEDLNLAREITNGGDIFAVVRKTNANSLLTHGIGSDAGEFPPRSMQEDTRCTINIDAGSDADDEERVDLTRRLRKELLTLSEVERVESAAFAASPGQ
jgi:hypothetical protein